jgi:hypothetical protein
MRETNAQFRRRLWQHYRALARTLRVLHRPQPMVPGACYRLQRRCGKPNCRCARGFLHATWVLTRSEAGRSRLYPVPTAQRGHLRRLTREYRRWQRARARFVKQVAALLALIDRAARRRRHPWPPPPDDEPGTD